jgi:2,4-dienoyl-CoA reductase-like NADH-dependent reductase (Old Yellow Enzyme family)
LDAATAQRLFTQLELRGRRLRNRIVSTPHATGWGSDGLIAAEEVDYLAASASSRSISAGVMRTFTTGLAIP